MRLLRLVAELAKLVLLFPVTYRVNAAGHMEVGGCDLVELGPRARHASLCVRRSHRAPARLRNMWPRWARPATCFTRPRPFASPRFLRGRGGRKASGSTWCLPASLYLALKSGTKADRIHFLGKQQEVSKTCKPPTTPGGHDRHRRLIRVRAAPRHRFRKAKAARRSCCASRPGSSRTRMPTSRLVSSIPSFGFLDRIGCGVRCDRRKALRHPRLEVVGLQLAHRVANPVPWRLRAGDGDHARPAGPASQRAEIRARACSARVGGLGIAYTHNDDPPTPRHFVEIVRHALETGMRAQGSPGARACGRSLGARSRGRRGIAPLHRRLDEGHPGRPAGTSRVDGGHGRQHPAPSCMGPATKLSSLPLRTARPRAMVTIAGKYCESTDILITGTSRCRT